MKIKFTFKEDVKMKASDGATSELDIEKREIEEQIEWWENRVAELEMSDDEAKLSHAQSRLSAYKEQLEDFELKATDMPVTANVKDILEPSTMREVVSGLRRFLRRDIPVMLSGASGFGKTELTKDAATGIPGFPVPRENIIDIRAGMMNVEDLKGIPMLVKNADGDVDKAFTQSTIPSWLKRIILNTDQNFVLFFDEINHASAPVLNSLYGIILERQLDEFKFGERTRIVAAGNTSAENEDLSELSTPLRNRLEIISIDKAVGNDPIFFHEFLKNKYKDSIPTEMLTTLFDGDEELSNARAVDVMLKAWAEDIADQEKTLTPSGAIPRGLRVQLQKMYEKKYLQSTGSQKHKEIIKVIADYITSLSKEENDFFGGDWKAWKVSDILEGKLEPVSYDGSGFDLNEKGKAAVIAHFSDTSPELVEAAIDKLMRG